MYKKLNPKEVPTHSRMSIWLLIASFMISNLSIPQAFAQGMPWMPAPGTRVSVSPQFNASSITGMVIHPENALRFDFLIDRGQESLSDAQKKEEYMKLVKYFMASLTVADNDQWVNLSPYEKNRIVEQNFGNTQMGRDLLAQDYLLKQITSSLMYPEENLGKKFWNTVYERAKKEYGATDVPVNTINKVWILPDKAEVFEKGNTVVILNSHLKVMLEEDYVALEKNSLRQPGDIVSLGAKALIESVSPSTLPSENPMQGRATQGTTRLLNSKITSQIVKQIILPELEKEVNEGKNFAPLRQIYSAMILSTWFKRALKESLLGKVYSDKNELFGVELNQPKANEEIYEQYLKAYKKGAFNYIKEEVNQISGERIPKKYFSGGAGKFNLAEVLVAVPRSKENLSLAGGAVARSDLAAVSLGGDVDFAQLSRSTLDNLRQKQYVLNDEEILLLIEELFVGLAREIPTQKIKDIFKKHIVYFKNPNNLEMFVNRYKKFNSRMFQNMRESLFITNNDLLDLVLFLMIVRGNIKDLVWDSGSEVRKKIEQFGGKPEAIYNLYAGKFVKDILSEVISSNVLRDTESLTLKLEWETGYKLKDFNDPQQSTRLFDIYSDEIVDVMRDVLEARKKDLRSDVEKIARIDDFLKKFNQDIVGDVGFSMTRRNVGSLKAGSLSGDCTSSGGMNYWAAGAFNAVFENNEIHVYHQNDFFARILFLTGVSEGKLTIWVHAVEFTPLARPSKEQSLGQSRFSDEQLKKKLLGESLGYLQAYAHKAGVEQIFLTGISNSEGFQDVLGPILKSLSKDHSELDNLVDRPMGLFAGINSAHVLMESVYPESNKGRVLSGYFQGWRNFSFGRVRDGNSTVTIEKNLDEEFLGGQQVSRQAVEVSSHILSQMVIDAAREFKKSLDFSYSDNEYNLQLERIYADKQGNDSTRDSFLDIVFDSLTSSDPIAAFRKNLESIKGTILELTGLIDPGAYVSTEEMFSQRLQVMGSKFGNSYGDRIHAVDLILDGVRDLISQVNDLFNNDARISDTEILDENDLDAVNQFMESLDLSTNQDLPTNDIEYFIDDHQGSVSKEGLYAVVMKTVVRKYLYRHLVDEFSLDRFYPKESRYGVSDRDRHAKNTLRLSIVNKIIKSMPSLELAKESTDSFV